MMSAGGGRWARRAAACCAGILLLTASATGAQAPRGSLVQLPYERPPQPQATPGNPTIPPSSDALSSDQLKRAEALLPMLEGKQEFWAMGEFVHLGPSVVPVLLKGLQMPGPRARYNTVETLSLMKDPRAVPALLDLAKQPNEMPKIREHALRVAVRLDPSQPAPTIEAMVKDPNATIRKAAAFEARYIRQKPLVRALISLLVDDERFVAITALQSLWILTRHESEMHDWEASSKEQRQEWAQEWVDWWSAAQGNFELPEPRARKRL